MSVSPCYKFLQTAEKIYYAMEESLSFQRDFFISGFETITPSFGMKNITTTDNKFIGENDSFSPIISIDRHEFPCFRNLLWPKNYFHKKVTSTILPG